MDSFQPAWPRTRYISLWADASALWWNDKAVYVGWRKTYLTRDCCRASLAFFAFVSLLLPNQSVFQDLKNEHTIERNLDGLFGVSRVFSSRTISVQEKEQRSQLATTFPNYRREQSCRVGRTGFWFVRHALGYKCETGCPSPSQTDTTPVCPSLKIGTRLKVLNTSQVDVRSQYLVDLEAGSVRGYYELGVSDHDDAENFDAEVDVTSHMSR